MSQPWNTGGDSQQPGEQYPQYGPGATASGGYYSAEKPYGAADPGYPPGYPQGYPAYPPTLRPGSVTATAVLAYVEAAMVLFGSLGAFAGGQFLRDNVFVESVRGWGAYFITLGVVGLVVGGLLIAGGVQVAGGNPMLVRFGNAGTLALCVGWLVLFLGPGSGQADGIVWPLIFAVMPVIGLALLGTEAAKRWLASRRR